MAPNELLPSTHKEKMTPPAVDSGSETETDDELYLRTPFEPVSESKPATSDAVGSVRPIAVNASVVSDKAEQASALSAQPQRGTTPTVARRVAPVPLYESDDEDEPPATAVRPREVGKKSRSSSTRDPTDLPSLNFHTFSAPAPVQIGRAAQVAPSMVSPPAFVSPFTALASTYTPPPPPVVGAPPVSYQPVPLHPPAISCLSCHRRLTSDSSPIPILNHSSCGCCGRYYHDNKLKKRGGQQLCEVCHKVPTPQVPTSTSSYSSWCNLCSRHLKIILPKSPKDTRLCQCCQQNYSRTAFPHFQLTLKDKFRRCASCLQASITPDKFKDAPVQRATNVSQSTTHPMQHRPAASSQPPNLSKSQRRKQRRAERAAQAAQTGGATMSVDALAGAIIAKTKQRLLDTVASTAVRHEMEIRVRDIKLARRSILRRREANDLRGSSRVEYDEQLRKEEEALNKKAARFRSGNPTLYDEMDRSIKVKAASVPAKDRDNAGKGKRKAKQKKPRSQPTAKRQKTTTSSEVAPPMPPSTITASAATTVKKETTQPAPTSSSRSSARKKIEIIDLVDSD